MSKIVEIPNCQNPFIVMVDGKRYSYPAGATVEVPDAVAEIIEQHHKNHNKQPEPVEPPFAAGSDTPGTGGTSAPSDWNASEGEPGYILNKPFGEVKAFEPIVWDGSTEGQESISVSGMTFYKIYGEYFEAESVESITANMNGEEMTAPGELYPADGGWTTDILLCSNGQLVAFDMTFPEGLWVIDPAIIGLPEGTTYTIHPKTTVKTIDGKYLPEGLPYEEGEVKAILTDAKPVDMDGTMVLLDALPLMGGNEYTVKWNGMDYKAVCFLVEEGDYICPVLGNPAFNGGVDNSLPFMIMAFPTDVAASLGVGAMVVPMDGSTDITVSITGFVGTVHKLSEKFMPFTDKVVVLEFEDFDSTNPVDIGISYDDVLPLIKAGKTVILREKHEHVVRTTDYTYSSNEYENLLFVNTQLAYTAGSNMIYFRQVCINADGATKQMQSINPDLITG